MNDMSSVIIPKSDQLNADTLLAGPRIITITGVDIRPGTEQPVSISFDGDDGKVWRPCKSMSRVLVAAWGPDASKYVGRSIKLFTDPTVTWGGMKVGGIRISHLSHIERDMLIALTATKGKKVMATIKPLVIEQTETEDKAAKWTASFIAKLPGFDTIQKLEIYEGNKGAGLRELKEDRPDLHLQIRDALDIRKAELAVASDPAEGRAETDMGDPFADDGADEA